MGEKPSEILEPHTCVGHYAIAACNKARGDVSAEAVDAIGRSLLEKYPDLEAVVQAPALELGILVELALSESR